MYKYHLLTLPFNVSEFEFVKNSKLGSNINSLIGSEFLGLINDKIHGQSFSLSLVTTTWIHLYIPDHIKDNLLGVTNVQKKR